MPRIITALFKDRAAAQNALTAVLGMGMARDRIAIVSGGEGQVSSISGMHELGARDDGAALHGLGLPEEDVAQFAAALKQGGALVSARIDSADMEQVIGAFEMFDLVDLDGASEAAHASDGGAGGGSGLLSAPGPGAPLAAGVTGGGLAGSTNTGSVPGMGQMADDTSSLGSADLRTDETSLSNQGRTTLPASGDRRAEERAGAPGVMEMGGRQETGSGAAGFRREPRRGSRVRVYSTDG